MTPDKLLRSILINSACHHLGIAPIGNVRHDFNRVLSGLPGAEARRMRRRFRKLWRKFLKNSCAGLSDVYVKQMEMGSLLPSVRAKTARKREVLRQLLIAVQKCKSETNML